MRYALLLFGACLVACGNNAASARSIDQTPDTLIERHGVVTLRGRTVAAAINYMLALGFRCGLVSHSHSLVDEQPYMACDREAKPGEEWCPTLNVGFVVLWNDAKADVPQLWKDSDSAKVADLYGMCLPVPSRMRQGGTNHNVGASALHEYVTGLGLRDKLIAISLTNLLAKGFRCGAEYERESSSISGFSCRSARLSIKHCPVAAVDLQLEVPLVPGDDLKAAVDASRATFKAYRVECL